MNMNDLAAAQEEQKRQLEQAKADAGLGKKKIPPPRR